MTQSRTITGRAHFRSSSVPRSLDPRSLDPRRRRLPPPPRLRAAPRNLPSPGYSRAALVLILVASFMVVLDFSIVNVALASIQRELGFAASAAQWVVTGYAITFGGLLILGGRAADLFGRRRMFVTGLIVFSVASLAGGLAQDPGAAGRVAGGAGRGRGAGRPGRAVADHHRLSRGPAAHPGARPVRRDRVGRVRGRPGAGRRPGRVHQLARGVPGQRAGRAGRGAAHPAAAGPGPGAAGPAPARRRPARC